MDQEPFFFLFSSAAPQRTAYSEVPSQMVYHLRTGNPLQDGEISGFQPWGPWGLQVLSGVATNELPLLPYLIWTLVLAQFSVISLWILSFRMLYFFFYHFMFHNLCHNLFVKFFVVVFLFYSSRTRPHTHSHQVAKFTRLSSMLAHAVFGIRKFNLSSVIVKKTYVKT